MHSKGQLCTHGWVGDRELPKETSCALPISPSTPVVFALVCTLAFTWCSVSRRCPQRQSLVQRKKRLARVCIDPPLENAVRSWKELMRLSLQRPFTASAGLAVIKVAVALSSHKPSDTPNSWEFPESHFSKLLPFKNFLFGALWIIFFAWMLYLEKQP